MAQQVVHGKDGGASGLASKSSYDSCVFAEYVWLDASQVPRSKTMTMTSRPSTPQDLRVWNYDGSSTEQAEGTNSEVLLYPRAVFHDPFLGAPHVLVLAEAYNAWDGRPAIGNTRAECAAVMDQHAGLDPWFGIEQEYTLMRPGPVGEKAIFPLGFNDDGSEPAPQGPYYTGAGAGVAIGRPVADEHYIKCIEAGVKISGINAEVMPGQWEFQVGPCRGIEMGDHLTMARYIMLRVTEKHNCVVSFDPKPMDGDWNGAGCHTNFSVAPMLQPGGFDVIIKVCQAFGSFVKDHISEYGMGNEKRLTGKHETCDINTFKYGVADRGASIRIPRDSEKDGKGYLEDRRPAANCDPYRVTSRIMKTTGWCLGVPNVLPKSAAGMIGCEPFKPDSFTVGKDDGAKALAQRTSFQTCVLAEYVWLDAFGVPRSKSMTMTSRPSKPEDCRVWNYDGSSTEQAEGNNSEVLLYPRAIFHDPFRGAPHVLVLAESINAWDLKPAVGNARAQCADIMEKCQALDPWFGIEQEYTLMRPAGIGEKAFKPLGFNDDGTEPAPQGPYYTGAGTGVSIGRPVADDHYIKCIEAGVKISGINAEVMPGQWEFQIGPCKGIEMGDHLTIARYIMLRVTESYNVAVSFDPKPMDGDWNGAGCHTNFSVAPMMQKGGYDVILKVCDAFGKVVQEHIAEYGVGNEKRLTGKHETCNINQFKYGVADRGASIRIPRDAEKDGKGYLEDRRPAANCDPYRVTSRIMITTASPQCLGIPAVARPPAPKPACVEFKPNCYSSGKDQGPTMLANMPSFQNCVLAEYVWLDASQTPRSKTMTLTCRPTKPEDCRVWNYDGSSTEQADGHNSEVLLYPRAVFHDPFRGAPHVMVLAEAYNAWDGKPAIGNTRAACAATMEVYKALDPWFGIEQEYTLMRPYRVGEPSTMPFGFNDDGSEPAPQGPYYTGVGTNVAIGRPVADCHYTKCIEAGVKISGINAEVMPGQWEFQIGPCRGIEMGDHLTMARYIMYRVSELYNVVVSFDPKPKDGDWNGAGCHTNFSVAPMLRDGGYNVIIDVCEAFGKVAREHIEEYGIGNEKRLTGKHETCDINTFKYGVANRGASIRIPRDAEKNGKGYLEDRRPAANCDPYRVTGRVMRTTGQCLGIPAGPPPAITFSGGCEEFKGKYSSGKDLGPSALAQMTSFQTCVLAEYVWLDAFQMVRSKTMTLTHRPTKVDDLRVWNYDGSSTEQAEGHNSEVLLYPRAVFHDPFRGAPHVLVLAEAYNAWDDRPSIGNTRAECVQTMEKYKGLDPWFGIEQEYTLMRPARVGEKSDFPLGFNEDGSEPAPQGPYYTGVGTMVAIGRTVADEHYLKCVQSGVKISGINAEVMPGQWEFQIGPCRGIEMGDHLTMARYIMLRVTENWGCSVSFDPKPREGDWNGAGCHTNFSVSPMLEEGGYKIIEKVCEAFGRVAREHIAEYGAGNEKRLTGLHETCDINTFKYGVANRGASIRIPREAEREGKGYMEDRRPAANCDPYRVTSRMLKTTGQCLGIPTSVPSAIGGNLGCTVYKEGNVSFGKDQGPSALARMISFQTCVLAEYVWLDAFQVTRSKTMTMTRRPTKIDELRVWNYDGSSTEQAEGSNSEVLLYPRAIFNDPFRGSPHIMVLCEAYNAWDGKPSIGNTRAECAAIMSKYSSLEPWFGIEQEYTFMRPAGIGEKARCPLGFNDDGTEPAPQGPYYTGAGTSVAIGRPLADEHKTKCLQAGVKLTGINAEVMPGQWEFQVGPCQGVEMGDHLTIARYIMLRVSENYGVVVSFDPKPMDGDWNGAGCHTNFSVGPMRREGGYDVIIEVCQAFGQVAKEHIIEYGDGNEKRLTGKHETCDINTFKFGVANRAASIRIPREAERDGKGYMEDRRPAANCDPYRVTTRIMKTTGQCLGTRSMEEEVCELKNIVQCLRQEISPTSDVITARPPAPRGPPASSSAEVSELKRTLETLRQDMMQRQEENKTMLQAIFSKVQQVQGPASMANGAASHTFGNVPVMSGSIGTPITQPPPRTTSNVSNLTSYPSAPARQSPGPALGASAANTPAIQALTVTPMAKVLPSVSTTAPRTMKPTTISRSPGRPAPAPPITVPATYPRGWWLSDRTDRTPPGSPVQVRR